MAQSWLAGKNVNFQNSAVANQPSRRQIQITKMFRIILIVALILISIPLFNKAKDYLHDKAWKAKAAGSAAGKIIGDGAEKAKDKTVETAHDIFRNPLADEKKK